METTSIKMTINPGFVVQHVTRHTRKSDTTAFNPVKRKAVVNVWRIAFAYMKRMSGSVPSAMVRYG